MAKSEKINIDKVVKPLSRTEQFRERIAQGELKTVGEWAVELYGDDTMESQHRIYGMMGHLRRRGVMAFPVKSDGPDEPSTVRIVNRELTNFVAAYNRHESTVAEPALVSSFRIAENLIREFPKVREQVIARAKHLIDLASSSGQELLGLPYKGSDKLLGGKK